ncbi:hypothetical protein BT93_E0533 [Corymbia citriodora subsp. variegata]|nr:hypothetical protein BT93_E0533 [Corymbia citriodora subsp. variegata]
MKSLANCIKSLVSQSLIPRALELAVAAPPALSPLLTDQAYALFLKSGHPLHPFLSTSLISRSAKNGDLSRSARLLSDTRFPDTVAFNALISGFASFRHPEPALALLDELRLRDLCPDAYTFSSLVKACGSVWENEIVHGVCLKYGFSSGAYVVSGLVENYAGGGEVGAAEKCFEECKGVDNVVWVAMVSGYVWNGEFESAKELFVEMRLLGLEVNEYSMTAVLGALLDGREGGQVHGFGLKMGLLSGCSLHLSNSIMHMYLRCGSQADAVKAFDEISEPDIVSWSERIFAACDGVEAFELFKLLHSEGVVINEFTVINLLSQIVDVKFLNLGKQIHALSLKRGHMQLVSVGNAFISLYGKWGRIVDATLVFDEMRLPDPISWNSLIAAYSENHLPSQCLEAFSKMRSHWVLPNNYALASILDLVAYSNLQEVAAQIHALMIKFGLMFDDSMVSALITAYGKCNRVDQSKKIFAKLGRIKALHLNSLLVTFISTGCHDDALVLFQRTWHSCIAVDSTTLSILLKACGALTDLEQGRTIHCLCIKNGFDQDSFIESAIVDVYCKCGSINDAEKAYKNILRANLVARNAMMMGYAQHGCDREVMKLFHEMSQVGLQPDEITYLAVLHSCCHAGLVEEGKTYLNSMLELRGVVPSVEHYTCVIDLLGRVGLMKDANRMINTMPMNPDARIWQILLSACHLHGDVDLGNIAGGKLLELQPENNSAYVLLSNINAAAGKWSTARELRREMKEKMLVKEPGSSWIQVKGTLNFFFADDQSHPDREKILMQLQELYGQMLSRRESEPGCASSVELIC